MNPGALALAAELGGTVLSSPGASLLRVARSGGHGRPQVLVLGRSQADLEAPLAGWGPELGLDLAALLPLPGCDLPAALALHGRRLGSATAALDAALPWLDGRPMLAKRLPGRARAAEPLDLPKAPMGPLDKAELKAFLPDWDKARRKATFRRPAWEPAGGAFEVPLWPGVELPPGAEAVVPPLELPLGTALMDALRAALRRAVDAPVPLLPLPADPSDLHALRTHCPDIAAFRGPAEAWREAYRRLAELPAPPHFCARC